MHLTILFFISYLVLFFLSYTVRYISKIVFTHLLWTVSALISLPIVVIRPMDNNNLRVLSAVADVMTRLVSDIRFEVRGGEHLRNCKKSAILVANHQSCLDGFACSQFWYLVDPCSIVSKRTLAFFGPLGLVLYLCGSVFIDRTNTSEAKAKLDADIKQRVSKNTKLLFFPEGTRNYNDSLLPFKKGAFHLAIKFQLPIIPIVFSSQKEYYNVKKSFWHSKSFVIQALPAISTEKLNKDDVDHLANSVRETMIKTFEEISKS